MRSWSLLGCGTLVVLCIFAEVIIQVYHPFIEQVRRYPDIFTTDTDFRATGSYKIVSETVLASLSNGKLDIFVPLAATPEIPLKQNEVLWKQGDYLHVADAVFEHQWKEPPSGWKLYRMLFHTDCQNNPNGFSAATITYFKPIWVDHTLEYTVRQVDIMPQYSEIDWGGDSWNYPHPILGWTEVSRGRLRFQADDALRIAEENGGKSARLKVDNKCSIHLVLYGDSQHGWDVFYDARGGFIFEMYINPYTGLSTIGTK